MIRGEEGDTSQMGVSYEVRIHIADSIDDYDGSKKNTVCMNIRKVSMYLGMYSSISDIRVGPDKSVLDRNFRKI